MRVARMATSSQGNLKCYETNYKALQSWTQFPQTFIHIKCVNSVKTTSKVGSLGRWQPAIAAWRVTGNWGEGGGVGNSGDKNKMKAGGRHSKADEKLW